MPCLERYFRNRLKLQIFSNYLGVAGALFFSLQNLSTNWGGNYSDDSSLTDAVKANAFAGVAWDEQYMQVGALLIAWMFYLLGAELQGNLSLGRYKRIMTWMVNVPVIAYMVGNMILSARRKDDGVETSSAQAFNIGVGVAFIVLSLANIIVYASDPLYKDHPWFAATATTLTDDPERPRINDAPGFLNNRFLPQVLLHVAVVACLMYFVIVGFVYYNSDKGWMLTDTYLANALAVRVWGIGGASVAMMAVPIVLMFVGFELQGDLPPNNYKPLAVFVGCLNTFVVSIFMYSTTWDAYDRGVITTDMVAFVIMIVLCIWAIACVVYYGMCVPYSDAYWIKVLADPRQARVASMPKVARLAPLPVHECKPTVIDAGYRHFDLAWQPVPRTPNHDVEYRIRLEHCDKDDGRTARVEEVVCPGTQPHLRVDRFKGEPIDHSDKFLVTVDYRKLSEQAQGGPVWVVPSHRLPTPAQPLPDALPEDWSLAPHQTDATLTSVSAEWAEVPGHPPASVEYHVVLTKAPSAAASSRDAATFGSRQDVDPDATEQLVVPGTTPELTVTSFAGRRLRPSEVLNMTVAFRRKTDAGEPQGGWQHVSEPVQLTTLRGDDVQSSWKVSPQQIEAGTRHASIGWSPPPATDPASIEYKIEMETEAGGKEEVVVPGEQHTHTIRAVNSVALSPSSSFPVRVSYRSKAAANQPGGGWGHMSPTLTCNTAAAPPDGWRVPLAAGDATPDSVTLVWEHPEHVPTHSAEYLLELETTPPSAAATARVKETLVLPGHQNQLTLRSVAGTPLEPRQVVRATARYRHQADADTDSGGWRYTSDAVQASTTRPPPPADWTPLPHATDVGMHHIVAEWAPVPDVPAEDVEYRVTVGKDDVREQYEVTGTTGFMIDEFKQQPLRAGENLLVSVEYRHIEDRTTADGGWQCPSAQVPMATVSDNLPEGWLVNPHLAEAGTRHLSLVWHAPPSSHPDDIEYRLRTTTAAQRDTVEEAVLPGTQREATLRSVHGTALQPATEVLADVDFRFTADQGMSDGGWQRGAGFRPYNTLVDPGADGWRLQPMERDAGTDFVDVEWQSVPDVDPEAVEYVVEVGKPGSEAKDVMVLPGSQRQLRVKEVQHEGLHPLEKVTLSVSFRYKADARNADGGWMTQHASEATPFVTAKPRPPPGWTVRPRATQIGAHHINVDWAPAPNTNPDDIEYLVRITNEDGEEELHVLPGRECGMAVSKFKGRGLQPGDKLNFDVSYRDRTEVDATDLEAGWAGASGPKEFETVSDNLPPDWKMHPQADDITPTSMAIHWQQPPGTVSSDLEYHLTCQGPEGSHEEFVLGGGQTLLQLDQVGGRALRALDTVVVDLSYRHLPDAEEEGGGWMRHSGLTEFSTCKPTAPEGWKVAPRASDVGAHHITADWEPVPNVEPEQIQYRVRITTSNGNVEERVLPGTQCSTKIDTVEGRSLEPGKNVTIEVSYHDLRDDAGSWQGSSGDVPMATENDGLPPDWIMQVKATEIGTHHIDLAWEAPPNTTADDLEYQLDLKGPEASAELLEFPGHKLDLHVTKVADRPLDAGDHITATVAFRHRGDASEDNGGWQRHSKRRNFKCFASLADWTVQPAVLNVTHTSALLKWKRPPVEQPELFEYYVKLTDGESKEDHVVPDAKFVVNSFNGRPLHPGHRLRAMVEARLKADCHDQGGGWGHSSGVVPVETLQATVPDDWHITAKVLDASLCDIIVGWDQPPYTSRREIEYCLRIADAHGGHATKGATEEYTVAGTSNRYFLDEFNGEPIVPGDKFHVNVRWRYLKDRGEGDRAWTGSSGLTEACTLNMTEPAALLESRVPRVFVQRPIMFKTNSDVITSGAEVLPGVANIMMEHPDMALGVEGHVNYGQKPASALRLSSKRAKRVVSVLVQQGVALARLKPSGHGYERPRFPRGSEAAKLNRRVEFRVLPGSGLYERLAAAAQARRDAINVSLRLTKSFRGSPNRSLRTSSRRR